MSTAEDGGLQVEQRLDSESKPRLLAFVWQEKRWVVNSVGRTWDSEGERHYLIMVQGDRVFELAHSHASGSWRLVRRPEDFGPPRKAT